MKTYCLWITLLTPDWAKYIVADLIEKNYMVSAIASTNKLCSGNGLSSVFAVRLSRDVDRECAYDDIKDIVDKLECKYYSLIMVPDAYDSKWNDGNVLFLNNVNNKESIYHLDNADLIDEDSI